MRAPGAGAGYTGGGDTSFDQHLADETERLFKYYLA